MGAPNDHGTFTSAYDLARYLIREMYPEATLVTEPSSSGDVKHDWKLTFTPNPFAEAGEEGAA